MLHILVEEAKTQLHQNYFKMSLRWLELLVSHPRRWSSSYREVVTPGQRLTAQQAVAAAADVVVAGD